MTLDLDTTEVTRLDHATAAIAKQTALSATDARRVAKVALKAANEWDGAEYRRVLAMEMAR